jgi:hypothetical protein
MTHNRSNVKNRVFVIPKDFISAFFEKLEDSGLEYKLTEVDKEGDLCVEVRYSSSEREEVMDLVELEDEFYDNTAEEDED